MPGDVSAPLPSTVGAGTQPHWGQGVHQHPWLGSLLVAQGDAGTCLHHLSLSPAGGWAVTGPTQVTAKLGGSLVVSCSYESGYELYPKYWCHLGFLWICSNYIAQTNGSEVTVTQGRVSIEDKHTECSFTVTLDNVSTGDAGWYSCGVRRRLWFNLQHSTKVTVSTGKARLGVMQGCVVELLIWVTAVGQDVSSQGTQGL